MRGITIFLGFCLALTVALALPAPQSQHGGNRASETERIRPRPLRPRVSDPQIRSIIPLHHFSSLQPRDWFSDLIRQTLNMSVKELLAKTEETFKQLDRVTNEGVEKLTQVLTLATPAMKDKIGQITSNAIQKLFDQIIPFLQDLGLVLPNISSIKAARYDAAADIIFALLGITLEDLVTAITNAMDSSLDLLEGTIIDLQALAGEAGPGVGPSLIEVSNSFREEGLRWLIPMLDQLRQIVPVTTKRTILDKSIDIQNRDDMLDRTISLMLGINIKLAASEAEIVLPKLINVLKSTRDVLNRTLTPEVQMKVMPIYNNAMDDVIRQAKPIFKTLLHFQEPARRDQTFIYNLLNSMLGIGADNFKTYLRFAANQIESTITNATKEMFVQSIYGGIKPAMDVWIILNGKKDAAKMISQPLLDILAPLVDNEEEEFVEDSEEWSNPDGTLFNRDALIDGVSDILTFSVSDATRELKVALERLDRLMETSLIELDDILEDEDSNLRSDILGIMNDTLTEIHIAMQPMLDVLLPFLPDLTRSNRDVALSIYRGINGLDATRFLQYCSVAAIRIPLLTQNATYLIEIAASSASDTTQRDIIHLLQRSDNQTKAIMKPFLDIVGHIITPL
ncbi:unnamed protein product [Orchesella dallaii]|uniref:Uncharacterized protein n=1 Tax=Orchesella dallaii TaxID=48710 RepID=A0ABP1QRQ6_9HEXA